MATAVTRRRWRHALARVAGVERASRELPARIRPERFTYAGRAAWATPAGRAVLPRGSGAEDEDGTVRARVGAEAVLVGKFDVHREVRLRAFYPQRGVTQRYQTGTGTGPRHGVERIVDAWRSVSPHDPGLMPEVLDDGVRRRGRGAWLVERTVLGRPARKSQVPLLVEPVTARLHRVQREVGIGSRRLSDIVSPRFVRLWQQFAQGHVLDPALVARVDALVGRDDLVEVSLGHGDLVGSNILLTGDRPTDGFVLIDWEFAGERPIAFDLAKLHLACEDHAAAEEALERGLRRPLGGGPGHYTFPEQVALAHVQALSWHDVRREKAEAAGRVTALEQMTARRIDSVAQLLGVG